MCCQSSGSFSFIWDKRGDAHLSHSFCTELSQFIVLKLIWPSSGTFQHHHHLTSSADTSVPTFAPNSENASLIYRAVYLALPNTMNLECLYDHTYSKSMDQPGKVANPARGQLNRENEHFPVRIRA